MEGPGIDDRTPGLELIFDLEALESNARTLASIYSIEPIIYSNEIYDDTYVGESMLFFGNLYCGFLRLCSRIYEMHGHVHEQRLVPE